MVLGLVAAFILGVVVAVLAAAAVIFFISRPAEGTYRVDHHRYDEKGRRVEGTDEVPAMNPGHARTLVLKDRFDDLIDNVERIGPR